MPKYIALLRGINVGGNNKIAMPELKKAFENQSFTNVITYINSGNVIFDSNLDERAIKTNCEALIESAFGLKITVGIIMGVKNPDGSVCYIIGIRKDIRAKIGKKPGDIVRVTVRER